MRMPFLFSLFSKSNVNREEEYFWYVYKEREKKVIIIEKLYVSTWNNVNPVAP